MSSSFDMLYIFVHKSNSSNTHKFNVYYTLTVYRLDQETHPDALLSLSHRQHDVTRLAIHLLALRRKGKFKFLEERQNYDLHFKNSVNNVNRRLIAQA